ncbi:MAG: glycosyltransferase [Candidatus Hydrogenedentes bacterium]|nr:glycosyltransferase [Candidatus Hydrogenedentota bacterium]
MDVEPESSTPRLSVVIPTLDGYRNGCVPRLLESVQRQTIQDVEIIMIKGVFPQGKAINQGAAQARGAVLMILDDDSELADAHVFERILHTLESDIRIGMAGASITLSPGSTPFQRRAAGQFPRFQTPVVDAITDSDLACHGCCAFPKPIFDAIGGEREDIMRGLDPDLRQRLRAAGYRVVLAPQARIYHPLPAGWKKLARMFFRNGFGSAYAQKFQPESVYETHEDLHDKTFVARRSLGYRVARFPLRLVRALITFQEMRFVAYTSYAAGYLWGWLTAKELTPHGNGPA